VEVFPSLHLAFVTGVLACGFALALPRSKGPSLLRIAQVRFALGLLALAILTIPFSLWPGGSVDHVLNTHLKLVIFFFLLAYCVRSHRDAATAVFGFFGGILALQLWVLVFNVKARAQVTQTYDPNDIAFIMVCAIPLAVSIAIYGQGIARPLAGLIAGVGVFVTALTDSRGGFVGVALVGAIILIRFAKRRPFSAFSALLAMALILATLAPERYWQRMGTIWGSGSASGPSAAYDMAGLKEARLTIWMKGLKLTLDHPILGVGAGVFQVAEAHTHAQLGRWETAHNSFLQISAELGLGGLGLFLLLLYSGVRSCRVVIRRARRDPRVCPYLWLAHGLELSLYGYAIVGFSLSHAYSWTLYFLLGMTVALNRVTTWRTVPAPTDAPLHGAGVPASTAETILP
jgi:O-antigen ligase